MSFKVYKYEVLGSTNTKAREFVKKGLSDVVVVAKRQTQGKGRFKRKWVSDYGGLYLTIVLNVEDQDKTKYLTFIASLSIVKAIKNLGLKAKVKWPNDVLVYDKKICGILTESISGKKNYALVGIGVNVNQEEILTGATSLFLETNKKHGIQKLLKAIIKEFDEYYRALNNKKYKKIIDEWKRNSHTLGRKIKVKTASRTYKGQAVGVDKECNLILKLRNGDLKKIMEGDVFIV